MQFRDVRRSGKGRRGVALVLALITVIVTATIAYSYVATQSTSLGIARNIAKHSQARYVAESGLELAVTYVLSSNHWRIERPNGVWVADEPFAGGTFTITGEDGADTDGDQVISVPAEGDGSLTDDGADPLTLTVTGHVNGASQVVRAVVTPIPTDNRPGVAVSDKVEVKNRGRIDSFDSSAGPYGGDNVSCRATVSTNSILQDKIKVKDDGVLCGDALAGPGGDPSVVIVIEDRGSITGSLTALTSAVVIPSLSEPTDVGSTLGDVSFASGTTLWNSNQRCKHLTIKETAVLQISGHITVLCDDDFVMDHYGRLEILPDSSLTLYTKKKIQFKKDAQANVDTAMPARFIIKSMATGSEGVIELPERAQVYAIVEAPDVELKINQTSGFFGTFVGKKVTIEGDGALHQDLNRYVYGIDWRE